MTNKNISTETTADREVVITSVINAPRELVFEAFIDPKQVVQWWGPNGFSTTIYEMDVRVGGVWKHTMKGPDGVEYPNKSIFKEIVKPERIAYSHGGGRQDKEGPGATFTATWTFETVDGKKTKATGRMIFPTKEARDIVVKQYNAIEGGKQTLGRLEEYLTKGFAVRDFVISREFNAPRELLWKAWTEPERMAQWWGPKGVKTQTVKMEFFVGGINHYCMTTPDGKKMWGKMVYREIAKPERIVFVNSFSDKKGGVARHPMSPTWPIELLSTITFAERQGKTTVVIRWTPINPAQEEQKAFDASHESMKMGWGGSLDQLAEYLAKC